MALELTSLTDLGRLDFDEIIDVRSPSEFADDHLPGAISLPVLSDEERARVGTIYVQEDRFKARKIGAALVAKNAAAHLDGPLADRGGGWRPLVYCWRGGQRSGSFAAILGQIGWRVDTIAGGYRSYRQLVVEALYDTPMPSPVTVIDGYTGTAKTRLLHHLAAQGAQVIDLEGLARHRGSLFGPMDLVQPSQKAFESGLAAAVVRLDPARPVFVEAESSKIGSLMVPPMLWKAMIAAGAIRLSAPLAARVAHSLEDYADVIADPARLQAVLAKLARYHGHDQVTAWQALAGAGDFARLAGELMERHYDPRYVRLSKRHRLAPKDLALPDLSEETLARAAARIVAAAAG